MKKLNLLIVFFLAISNLAVSQSFTVIPNLNLQAAGGFAPNGSYTWTRTVFLVTPAEMVAAVVPGTQSFNYMQLHQYIVANPAATGTVNIYMENTTNTTYSKSSTWSTAISTMAQVGTNIPLTFPLTATYYTLPFNTSNFNYNGGGVYVAIEYSNLTNPLSTANNHSVNNSLSGLAYRAQVTTPTAPATLTATSFRPELILGLQTANDISVNNVYSLGKMPIEFAAPTFIRANISNVGSNPQTNVVVSLSLTGNNSFTDNVTIPSLAPGASTEVTFAAYSPTSLSAADLITVSVPSDDNNNNNSKTWNQEVTQNVYSYKNQSLPNDGGVGFTGGTGDFVAKFKSNQGANYPYNLGPPEITEIKVDFAAGGQPYQVGIWDATGAGGTPGSNLWTSATFTSAAGAAFIAVPSIQVTGDYFVGVKQIGTTNVSFAYQTENPIRSGTFYYNSGAGWVDFSPGAPFRFSIDVTVHIPAPPNCAINMDPLDNAVLTCENPTLSWGSGGGSPTSYNVYLSTNQIDVDLLLPTALVSANQLGTTYSGAFSPNTTYYWAIIPENADGPAAGCNTFTFTTGSLPNCYCIPFHSFVCTDAITNVTFNTLNNTTTCAAPGYSSYPNSGATTTSVNAGSTYSLSVTTDNNNIISMWIDYDQNGTFDASEWTQVATTSTAGTATTIPITIPTSALTGNTLMRIRSRLSANANGATDPCTSFGSGESEDYVITILPQPPCAGTPTPGNTIASVSSACNGSSVNLSLQNFTPGTGVTYQWQSADDAAFSVNLVNLGTLSTETITVSASKYYRCEVTCSGNTGTSIETLVTLNTDPCVCATYCAPTTSNTCDEFITNVTFAGINNNSGCDYPYAFFSNISGSVQAGNTYTLNYTAAPFYLGDSVEVYFDWNQDGDFDDLDETYSTNNLAAGISTISVPPTALAGSTRMRVRLAFGASPTACNANSFSEAEDYCVTVTPAVACSGTPTPGNTIASASTVCAGGSVNLSLQNPTNGTGVTYQWQSADDAGFTINVTNYGTASTQTVTLATIDQYYRCNVTCSGSTGTSTPVLITVNNPTIGTNQANAIAIGQAPCVTQQYTNTVDNACHGDDFTGANNQPSPDVWYSFTLANPATVEIGLCGSAFDTYLHLLDGTGSLIVENDDAGPLCTGLVSSISASLPAGSYYIVAEGFDVNEGNLVLTLNTTDPCNANLNATFFIQGYYAGASTMQSVLLNQGVSGALATEVDDVTVDLMDGTSPYALAYSFNGKLLTDGTITCTYPGAAIGNSYYIRLTHRNSIETWSANPVAIATSTVYNFSTSASQAFGGNQIDAASDGVYSIYNGDVTQDGTIDIFDFLSWDADNQDFFNDFYENDFNGDGVVDIFDFLVWDPNNQNLIGLMTP